MIRHPLLEQAAQSGIRLGLERMRSFMAVLGEPQLCAPAVHVAGTNGKGSVCTYVTRILLEAGYRVGTTLSPHVEHINERVQIDGAPISDASLVSLLEQVDRARIRWGEEAGLGSDASRGLTYFEMAISTAFLGFAQHNVDVQVVEVGLGGRLDATNLVQPAVCAVPHIGLDHQDLLGDTLAQIAGEKAGIFKRGVPVVLGPIVAEAKGVLLQVAERLGCPCWSPPAIRRAPTPDGRMGFATPRGTVEPVALGMIGRHQGANAMVAVGVAHQLREQGFHVPDTAIRDGLASAAVPGRLEEIRSGLWLDGAHNPDGARALAQWLDGRSRVGHRILLFGMGEGRDPRAILEPLVPHFDEVVTTQGSHPRAVPPERLAVAIEGLHPNIAVGGAIEESLPEVYGDADETVVAGSLFIVGAVRALAGAGALDGEEE